MLMVGLFASALVLVMVFGDWLHFTSLKPSAVTYGCGVARQEEQLPLPWERLALNQFDAEGFMALPHGVARLFREDNYILLRPQYHFFSRRFRTAWPIKGTIDVGRDSQATRMVCVKRIPWSSAIFTALWFALVGLGTVGFLIAYILKGGAASLGSVLVGLAVVGTGTLVFLFGLVTVVVAYRLEDERLRIAYGELRAALLPDGPVTDSVSGGAGGLAGAGDKPVAPTAPLSARSDSR